MKQTIINCTQQDIDAVSDCHLLAFPDSIAVKLGKGFVCKMLEWYISAPNKFLFMVQVDSKCIGYCGGYLMDGTDTYGASSGMTQFGFAAAVKAMLLRPWLFLHPDVRARYPFIARNLLRKLSNIIIPKQPVRKTDMQEIGENIPLTAGLVVIGVNPVWQGKGVGSVMQQEFEKIAIRMGAKRLQLSVRTNNSQAIKSYQKNGYSICREEGLSYIMVKELFNY